jgi:aspartate ammonia-lyase
VVAVSILETQKLFYKTLPLFRTNCIDGITVNKDVQQKYINQSVGIVTSLNPVLGYEKTTELAKEALESGKGILELIREKKLLTEKQIKELMDPVKLTTPNGPININE